MVHGGGHHSGGGGGGGGSSSSWGGNDGGNHHRDNDRGYNNIVVVNNSNSRGGSSYQNSRPGYFNHNSNNNDTKDCCRDCHPGCPFISFSSIFFMILLIISGVNEDWTLNAGETRKIQTKATLNTKVFVASNIPDSTSIYTFPGACPPLTGPLVSLESTQDISLAQGDYQYDYFYLNAGSSLDVTVGQESGATNVILVRGLAAVEDSNGQSDDDSFSFEGSLLVKKYAGAGQTAHVKYTVRDTDTYVVIYDNASNKHHGSKATVSYNVTLTTYNLEGKEPVSDCAGSLSCQINVGHDCILVRADKEVTVHVSTSRRWGVLLLFSSIPILIGLCCLGRRHGCCCQDTTTGQQKEDDYEYPSATAPTCAVEAAAQKPIVYTPIMATATTVAGPLTSIPESELIPMAVAVPEPLLLPSAPPAADDKV
mmetsp:Transcript_9556/g.15922  ORF Transcript_9556/g.15922 Transcript_9556/m.15922 type:complete len:424 (+) Transcript_9556:216-1487(+)|eukprot:CAMPEP_0119022046 /NCGR_PEP_ID=MMETSP1176-20130426/27191_1 /TAXON_ID=265551 /ORGANISM="Synedropsis recta cf, Strain CCMP1620" /LENGTH=423 /DNA_ID=CAMNT_0006976783 /DNA_START=130 /DNA_END=1401 /DNA_ORIENTATION=+